MVMALTATLGMVVSSTINSTHHNTTTERRRRVAQRERRGLLLSTAVLAAAQVIDSKTDLLQKYLKKSEENRAKNDKERLDSYYKRNYKDYFGFVEGSLKQKKEELSESEKGILEWLEANK